MNTQYDMQLEVKSRQRGNNVVLIGSSGSGKSTVGRALSRLLGYGFLDTDEMVARAFGKAVDSVFRDIGEEAFRKEEAKQVNRMKGLTFHVIATGGGTLERSDNREILFAMGLVFWLRPPVAEVASRLLVNEDLLRARPLLAEVLTISDKNLRRQTLETRIKALSDQRADVYRDADLEISQAYMTVDATALLIKNLLTLNGLENETKMG